MATVPVASVPVAVPVFVYWPTMAVPVAAKTQVSPRSSLPLELASPL